MAANTTTDASVVQETPTKVSSSTVPLTEDHGVLKEIIQAAPAENVDRPETGDEVSVHYTGRLVDGTVFDSSVERKTPFTFTLGKGQVIKGWDIGVASMRQGERVYLTCSPDYAYGKNGSPPKIPADATLIFEVELLSWKSHNDLTGDGGVVKKVLRRAEDDKAMQAEKGHDVSVHFKIRTVDGQDLHDTRTTGQAVHFRVGSGAVMKALDKVVPTMKVGDVVAVTAHPAYAWGEAGHAEYHVPPNTTVQLEVELVQCVKTADVLRDEPGKLVKRILKENSSEYQRPTDRSTVTVALEIRKVGAEAPLLHHVEPTDVRLNAGDLPEVADLLITSMRKGETAEVVAAAGEFGYGVEENQRRGLEAGAQLHVRAELVDIKKDKETWDMSVTEKLEVGAAYKDLGNTYFRTQQFRRALRQYKEAIELFRYDSTLSDDEKQKANELKLPCHLNTAACALRLKEFRMAREHCDKALAIDSKNVKALFRRAQAHSGVFDHELAKRDALAGLQLEPANKDLRTLLIKIQDDLKAQMQKEKNLFAGKLFKRPLFDHEKMAQVTKKNPAAEWASDSEDEAMATDDEKAESASSEATPGAQTSEMTTATMPVDAPSDDATAAEATAA